MQNWTTLDSMSGPSLESYLARCELLDFQKDECSTEKKLEYYKSAVYRIRLSNALKIFSDFRTYLRFNKLFVTRDLLGLFAEIEKAMIDVSVRLEMPDGEPWASARESFRIPTKDVTELLDKVEPVVQERLNFNRA